MASGGVKFNVSNRVNEMKIGGWHGKYYRNRRTVMKVKEELYEKVLVFTVRYGL